MQFFRKISSWRSSKTEPEIQQEEPKQNVPPTQEGLQPPPETPAEGSFGSLLWNIVGSKMGMDVFVSGVSLPAWMYEPLSILQRQVEMVEHSCVLSEGAKCTDSIDILAYVAAFTVSSYSATQRYKPSFNPMLGETFEYIDRRNNTRCIAEQVSHHPPISALHVENENWQFWQNTGPSTKFLGNSLDLITHGQSYVYFPKTKDHFHYTNPCTRVHNVIFGSMWLEHFGQVSIKNHRTGHTSVINFKKSGMFQGTQYKVEGYVYDEEGNQCVKIEGRWDEYVDGTWLIDTKDTKKGETKRLWQIPQDNFLGPPYNFSRFAATLNDCDEYMQELLPPTDSRRRLDRLFLEREETDIASKYKKIMEERQRQDKKKLKGVWKPVWFKEIQEHAEDKTVKPKTVWVYSGNYWEQRAKKEELLRQGKDFDVKDEYTEAIKDFACDFSSYGIEPHFLENTNTTTTSTEIDGNTSSSEEIEILEEEATIKIEEEVPGIPQENTVPV